MSGAASVNIKEVDLSTRVASFEGVFGAIVIEARKGSTTEPGFISSDTQLLNEYTPNGKVEVGYDLAYFSALAFLERANKLWTMRASNSPFYAGATIVSTGAVGANAALPDDTDLADPSAYVFGADDVMLLYSANEGVWGDDVGIKITTVVDNPDLIEPNSFLIEVFLTSNQSTPVESFLCSRVLGQLDGAGRNMFVEDVLNASAYLRARSNPVIADTTLPKTQSTILFLNDGDDGSAVGDTQAIAALNEFANKAKVDVTLLMDGGRTTTAYHTAMDTVAQSRQDCVAILSVPFADEDSASYITDIVDYRKTELNLNSSYSALYTPHVQIQDRFNARQIFVSPDGYVAGSISFASQQFEIWFPPAGFKRGVLNVLDVKRRYTDGELDVLYNNQINPIRFFPGRGIVVWGQKTLLSRASALDRLNVRLLLIVIEPAIKELLENYLFDLNEVGVRTLIEGQIEDYLETIRAKKGITDFDVVADDTNNSAADIDANRLNVDIFIKPTRSIEEIPVRVVITPTGISFSDAAGAI